MPTTLDRTPAGYVAAAARYRRLARRTRDADRRQLFDDLATIYKREAARAVARSTPPATLTRKVPT